mmetsp:Transcript_15553/g.32936  ORF Transcript_15553/g.32936 Transcript_15553/m.32936 type:complete len:214 (+) Transcript_15553:931-1572(+)
MRKSLTRWFKHNAHTIMTVRSKTIDQRRIEPQALIDPVNKCKESNTCDIFRSLSKRKSLARRKRRRIMGPKGSLTKFNLSIIQTMTMARSNQFQEILKNENLKPTILITTSTVKRTPQKIPQCSRKRLAPDQSSTEPPMPNATPMRKPLNCASKAMVSVFRRMKKQKVASNHGLLTICLNDMRAHLESTFSKLSTVSSPIMRPASFNTMSSPS